MIPARYGPVLFSLLLSGMMSLLVSGVATWRALPTHQAFLASWMGAWLSGWMFAFPAVMVAAPLARKAVARLLSARGGG